MHAIVKHLAKAFYHLGQALLRLSGTLQLWLVNHPKKEDDNND